MRFQFYVSFLLKPKDTKFCVWSHNSFHLLRSSPVPDCASCTLGSTLTTAATTDWHRLNVTKNRLVRHSADATKNLQKNIIATAEIINKAPVLERKDKYLRNSNKTIFYNGINDTFSCFKNLFKMGLIPQSFNLILTMFFCRPQSTDQRHIPPWLWLLMLIAFLRFFQLK